MKKHIFLRVTSLVAALAITLCACSSKDTAADKSSSAPATPTQTYGTGGNLPIVQEKITLTAIIPSVGWIPDINNNKMVKYLEEKTNIHIEWMEVAKEEYQEKLEILIAGNECPDIVLDIGLTKAKYDSYGQQGLFVDVSQYMDQYSTYLKPLAAEYPQVANYMKANDGKSYFVPSYDSVYHMTMRTKYWMNQKWLDNLGLAVPTTTEEFREVLRQFKAKDANGNGDPNDEIPMTGALRALEDTASYLISSFIPAGSPSYTRDPNLNNYTFIIDEKPNFTADKDEFKEGIAYAKSLYDEGLYDPAAFTQNRDQIKPLVDGGDVNRVGGLVSHHPGNFAAQTDIENGRYREFVSIAPLKGPEGFQSSSWDSTFGLEIGGAITKNCKDPVAAFIWLDYFLSNEIAMISKNGWEGTNWEPAQSGDIGFDGTAATYRLKKGPIHEENEIMGFYGPKNGTVFNGKQAVVGGYNYEQALYEATMAHEPYKVSQYPFVGVSMTEEDAIKLMELSKNLESYVGESVDRFILGDLSLEKDWANYLGTLDQIGLKEYMEILNKYYANYKV